MRTCQTDQENTVNDENQVGRRKKETELFSLDRQSSYTLVCSAHGEKRRQALQHETASRGESTRPDRLACTRAVQSDRRQTET